MRDWAFRIERRLAKRYSDVELRQLRSMERAYNSRKPPELLVFGDSAMVLNVNWGNEVLRNLVLNAFGWTSTQFQKITIRPPDLDISTITIDDTMFAQIQFLSMVVLPQVLIALGIAIRVSRRSR